MTLTPAGRLVAALLALALFQTTIVVGLLMFGQWDAAQVVAVVAAVPTIVLIAVMWWRWEA